MTNYINQIKSKLFAGGMLFSFLTASMLFTFSSCADDHFNINSDVIGTKTVWENINENEELSDYAYILKNIPYSQVEKGFTKETYADILNGDQTFTVWAPKNGSYDFQYYKELIESGSEENLKLVEKQLIRNNMTRYSHLMNGQDSLKVMLFNTKVGWINYNNNTFLDTKVIKSNVASSNGALHITAAPATFTPNLYEYISMCKNIDSYKKFIKTYEEEEFDEHSSSPGPTVNGQATWVDSITFTYNSYLRGKHAYIEREDSNYVVVLPTDNAWKDAYAKAIKNFRYKNSYVQDVHTTTENGSDTLIKGMETVVKAEEMDSIKNFRSANSITKDLFFNANWQPKQASITSLKALSNADSLVSTSNEKFKKIGTLNETNDKTQTHESANYAEMFGGKEPIKLSNGYAYIADSWKFPSSLWAPTLEYKPNLAFDSEENKTSHATDIMRVTYEDEDGSTHEESYEYMQVDGTTSTNYTIRFKLRDVLSCKYDIYLVTVHNDDYNKPTMFKTEIVAHRDSVKAATSTDSKIYNLYQGSVGSFGEDASSKTSNFYTHVAKVDTISTSPLVLKGESLKDTICIAKDYEFPFCYYNLTDAYPILTIKGSALSADINEKKGGRYCRSLRIMSIILKPKAEEE